MPVPVAIASTVPSGETAMSLIAPNPNRRIAPLGSALACSTKGCSSDRGKGVDESVSVRAGGISSLGSVEMPEGGDGEVSAGGAAGDGVAVGVGVPQPVIT